MCKPGIGLRIRGPTAAGTACYSVDGAVCGTSCRDARERLVQPLRRVSRCGNRGVRRGGASGVCVSCRCRGGVVRVLETSGAVVACPGRHGRPVRRPGAGHRYARSSRGRWAVVFWFRPVRHASLRASSLGLYVPARAGDYPAGLERLESTDAATGCVLAASIASSGGGRVCDARQSTAPCGPCFGIRGAGLRRVMALSVGLRRDCVISPTASARPGPGWPCAPPPAPGATSS
jgi:hypothetical protein